jgi:lysylphosphatidylglycerol synthetase-like protein (DUF2156 family)
VVSGIPLRDDRGHHRLWISFVVSTNRLLLPDNAARAREIITRYGRSSLDYFKLRPDKPHFFGPSSDYLVAWSVGANFAVDLTGFNLDGRSRQRLRQKISQLERAGIRVRRYDPPLSAKTLARLKAASSY